MFEQAWVEHNATRVFVREIAPFKTYIKVVKVRFEEIAKQYFTFQPKSLR